MLFRDRLAGRDVPSATRTRSGDARHGAPERPEVHHQRGREHRVAEVPNNRHVLHQRQRRSGRLSFFEHHAARDHKAQLIIS
eukprot:949000-Pleurochrysis_carterae.AAC.1